MRCFVARLSKKILGPFHRYIHYTHRIGKPIGAITTSTQYSSRRPRLNALMNSAQGSQTAPGRPAQHVRIHCLVFVNAALQVVRKGWRERIPEKHFLGGWLIQLLPTVHRCRVVVRGRQGNGVVKHACRPERWDLRVARIAVSPSSTKEEYCMVVGWEHIPIAAVRGRPCFLSADSWRVPKDLESGLNQKSYLALNRFPLYCIFCALVAQRCCSPLSAAARSLR